MKKTHYRYLGYEKDDKPLTDFEKGITLLDKGGRRAVRMSLVLYREILLIIKNDPYVVLRGRVRVSKYRKIILIIKNFY